ncbi:Signal transduction histidine kinase CheA [hydrothermal vent metagenome]|uniref:Chemotaxis protein CheA n=1 Tax=hydrothermal vent metagenome TaxID=652676 RepID=A0A3B1D8F6_9ZZZZ
MSFNNRPEVLETIDEINSFVLNLDPELTDKKAISDVMLAIEKILPDIRQNLPASLAVMCETLGLLYEKFLMEMVDDASRGIDLTKEGLVVLKGFIDGTTDLDQAQSGAVRICLGIKNDFDVVSPDFDPEATAASQEPEKASPATADAEEESDAEPGDETGGGGDDPFFAEMASQTPPEPLNNDDESETADPVIGKLSKLASDVTMLDADMTDKKIVSDVMMEFEQIQSDLIAKGSGPQVASLASALGLLYEKILMEGISDGQKAIDQTTDGIMLLSSFFEGAPPEDLPERSLELVKLLTESFGVDPPQVSQEDAAPSTPAAMAEPAQDQTAPAQAGQSATSSGVDNVSVATEDDLLIYTEFVIEVGDSVSNIESDLLELEENPTDEELINNLFRAYHSMKGAAGFLGVSTVNILCHEAETLLDRFRKKIMVCNQDMMDALLKAVDVIKLVNEGLDEACRKIQSSLPDAKLEIPRYDIDSLVRLLAALSEPEKLAEGQQLGDQKEPPGVAPLGEMLLNEGKVSEQELAKALEAQQKHKHLGEILVDMGAIDKTSVDDALKAQSDKKRKVQASSLKIDTEKLDSLLELVGELVISQSIVSQDRALNGESNRALFKNITNLGKITKNIQDQVMTLRMVQLKQTFQKMSRLVRDLSKKMNKKVNFRLSGEETEIDKSLIEQLNDPLVHLLRNSMDHGIESPEQRLAAGKSKTGEVHLSAFHRGGNVHIEIIDDGQGLDTARVLEKAIEKGLVDSDKELTEQEVINLIMMPGFSTNDVATDVSGRGVGMDVVRSNVDALGGRLEITSKEGKGTSITVKLPLTMAIVDGMIVKIGEERFVIPTISIRESIRPNREDISTYKNTGEMIDVRGHLLPLVRLHRFLGFSENGSVHLNPWEGIVIVVENEDNEFGFMVDDLLGQQQVVIKSLGKRFKGLPGISGGTILGDGHVGLILDVSGVVTVN